MANSIDELRDEIQKLKDENVKSRRIYEDLLNNIDFDNLTPECVSLINKPVYSKIEDTNGNVAELALTAEGLATRITSAEGNISTLTLTASGLTTRISDAEGNISSLQITSSSLNTRISSAEGNISTLQQTASSLSSKITSAEGNISSLQQTASSLSASVISINGRVSSIELNFDGLTLSASNYGTSSTIFLSSRGINLSSTNIAFTGVVTFSDLTGYGTTQINGANIMTGTINANAIGANDMYGAIKFNNPINLINGGIIFDTWASIGLSGTSLSLSAATAIFLSCPHGLYVNGTRID